MNQKYLFTAIAVVIVLIIGLFIYNNSNKDELASNTNTAQNANTENQNNANANTVNTNTSANANVNTGEPTAPDGNDTAVFEISYDGKAFNPSQLTIHSGDVVIFKNESTTSFWPASGPHPTHTNYPEFDPKKAIAPGKTWEFKFTKVGTWPFHDHLNPSAFGKIIVQ